MKKTGMFVIVLLVFVLPMVAYAQSAKEAMLGLKKLQARTQAGISYKDYSSALGEAKFPVNLFMESEESKKSPELAASMNRAMQHYETAGSIWTQRMTARSITRRTSVSNDEHMLSGGFIAINSSLGQMVKRLYPDAEVSDKYYTVGLLLSKIWSEASKELKQTDSLITQETTKARSELETLQTTIKELTAENAALKAEIAQLKQKPQQKKK